MSLAPLRLGRGGATWQSSDVKLSMPVRRRTQMGFVGEDWNAKQATSCATLCACSRAASCASPCGDTYVYTLQVSSPASVAAPDAICDGSIGCQKQLATAASAAEPNSDDEAIAVWRAPRTAMGSAEQDSHQRSQVGLGPGRSLPPSRAPGRSSGRQRAREALTMFPRPHVHMHSGEL